MTVLNDDQIEILKKYKNDLRRGNLTKLVSYLTASDSRWDRSAIIAYLIEHGVPILESMQVIPTHGIVNIDVNTLVIPGNVKAIKSDSIYHTGIEHIIIEPGVELIEVGAMGNNDSLIDIKLPEGIKLSKGCFADNPKLQSVFIPDSVIVLPPRMFEGCGKVTVTANYRPDKANRLKCVENEIPWYKEHLKWIRND